MKDNECPEYGSSCVSGCYVCHPLCPKPQCDSCPKCCPRWSVYFGGCLNDVREERRLEDKRIRVAAEQAHEAQRFFATLNRVSRGRGKRVR